MNDTAAPFSSDPLLHQTSVLSCAGCGHWQHVHQSRPKSCETGLWTPSLEEARHADGSKWQFQPTGVFCSAACAEAGPLPALAPVVEHHQVEHVVVGDEAVPVEHVAAEGVAR